MTRRLTGPLIHAGENDYILPEGCTSVWLTVDDISVYVYRVDDVVAVELLPHYDEATRGPLDFCETRRYRGDEAGLGYEEDFEEDEEDGEEEEEQIE